MHVTQPAVLLSFPRCEEAKECWPTSLTHRPSLAQCFSGCVVTGVVLLCEARVKQCHELLISAHDGKAFEAYISLFFFAVFPLCFFHFVFRFLRSFTCCGAVHCQTCSLFRKQGNRSRLRQKPKQKQEKIKKKTSHPGLRVATLRKPSP